MNSTIVRILNNHVVDLSVDDKSLLESKTDMILDLCKSELKDLDQVEMRREFYNQLAGLGLRLRNFSLLFLVIEKLSITKVFGTILTTARKKTTCGHSIAFYYTKDYFESTNRLAPELIKNIEKNSKGQYLELTELNIDRNNYSGALELTDNHYNFDVQCKDVNRLSFLFSQAVDLETDENFRDALAHYRLATTQRQHAPRLIIKQYVELAFSELEKYCLDNENMHSFWMNYLKHCKHVYSASKKCSNHVSTVMDITLMGSHEFDGKLDEIINTYGYGGLSELNTDIWLDQRKLRSMLSSTSSISRKHRRTLAILTLFYQRVKLNHISANILLVLNQADMFMREVSPFLDQLNRLHLASYIDAPSNYIGSLLVDLMLNSEAAGQANGDTGASVHRRSQVVFATSLKLGLMDEAITLLVEGEDIDTSEAVTYLGSSFESRHSGALDVIDPTLQKNTLSYLGKSLNDSPTPSTNVITIVIFCIAIFIYKATNLSLKPIDLTASMKLLEAMFKHLADFCTNLNYNASDEMIVSTKTLINIVKDNLELFADCDTIRESFRQVVNEVAGHCMIEASYKNAAMLYSQVEDNIRAVKSLMRTGDVEVVINYSLLVRDISVHRITINYLKHLRVDKEIIEDFMERCKT